MYPKVRDTIRDTNCSRFVAETPGESTMFKRLLTLLVLLLVAVYFSPVWADEYHGTIKIHEAAIGGQKFTYTPI
jgi:hypothetical protein